MHACMHIRVHTHMHTPTARKWQRVEGNGKVQCLRYAKYVRAGLVFVKRNSRTSAHTQTSHAYIVFNTILIVWTNVNDF